LTVPFWRKYDEYNIEVQFKSAATVSITYALMSRCGLEPEQYFSHEDFMPIFDFNTPAVIGALGTAVSQATSRCCGRSASPSRTMSAPRARKGVPQHGEQPDLHSERGLPDPRPAPERAADEAPEQVRQDAQSVPERTPAHLYNHLLMTRSCTRTFWRSTRPANRRLEQMMPQLAEAAGATEALKAADPMQWVGLMNTCKAQAEEILLAELINS